MRRPLAKPRPVPLGVNVGDVVPWQALGPRRDSAHFAKSSPGGGVVYRSMQAQCCVNGSYTTSDMEPNMVAQDDHVSPRYVTYHGAVEYTSLSPRTLAKLVAEGKLHPARVGRRVLLDVQELDRFLEERKG